MSSSSKKVGGRPASKIWEWFIRGDQISNSKGYCSATCSFCEYHWTTAKVAKHLAYECNKVSNTKISALMMLTSNCEDSEFIPFNPFETTKFILLKISDFLISLEISIDSLQIKIA